MSEKIVPDPEDFEQVEREYPDESPAQKYRLAQATALIKMFWREEPRAAAGAGPGSRT